MRAAVLVACVACLAVARGAEQNDLANAQANPEAFFANWAAANSREYVGKPEYAQRLSVFQDNLAFIAEGNAANGLGFEMGLNEFADLTEEEFIAKFTGYRPELEATQELKHRKSTGLFESNIVGAAPESVDWREKGAVSKIKNQGSCGSCWAFSATGAIEGINAIKTGDMQEVSVQELVDCDSVDKGCNGGLMDNAFDFIIENGGIDTWEDYRYLGFPLFCNRAKRVDRPAVVIDGHEAVPVGDEGALAVAVAQQPTSVAICVNRQLQFYRSGVFDHHSCLGLNHGVLVVGYGATEAGQKYWLVKNSWGAHWGEQGFIRMAKDVSWREGMNGITLKASYPLKSSPNPAELPEICDFFGWWECPAPTSCSCSFSFFGLFCLKFSCADGAAATMTAAGEAAIENGGRAGLAGAIKTEIAEVRAEVAHAAAGAAAAVEAAVEGKVTCEDGVHTCPKDFPDCDVENDRCFNTAGTAWVPTSLPDSSTPTLTADVRCKDGKHTCPTSFPKCDIANARCYNTDATEWVPMSEALIN